MGDVLAEISRSICFGSYIIHSLLYMACVCVFALAKGFGFHGAQVHFVAEPAETDMQTLPTSDDPSWTWDALVLL